MATPGRFFYANMMMGVHLIEQARIHGLKRFVHVGTICSYPKYTPVPFREEDLWNGYPEETNAPYGIAKKAVGVMLDAYHRQYELPGAYVLPVNLYGSHDNFDPESSHVIPALIRKCIVARDRGDEVMTCWGTGSASREFLHVDDAAEGIVRSAEVMTEPVPINLGTNREITIRELVALIADTAGFEGEIRWDASRPDGQPRRCVDTSRAKELLGWEAKVPLQEGLKRTMDWWQAEGTGHSGEQGS
jgi:GDP-L-fucose synthase